ncbi:MAG: tetratricopeptide repeat protein [Spirochaetaceae bacterium]|nr:tetratricopeptide repeat protein [Spirochaetaceae bacterium]
MEHHRARRPAAASAALRGLLCLFLALAAAAPALAAAEPGAREYFAAAEAKRFSEDWYGAVEDYLAALAKNPAYSEALFGLAECYYVLEEYDQALAYARKAAPLRRADPALKDLEGFIRLALGDLAGARALFAAVLAELPNDLDARFGLTLLDLAAGKKTDARLRLEESLRLSPENARALLSLALVAQDQGKAEEGRALVEKALRFHGEEPRVQFTAARLAAAEGDRDRAVFHARNALAVRPDYADARRLLAGLMYEAASYEESAALMREAVAANRKDAAAWFTLGLAQAGAGRPEEAIYSLRQAVSLKPDDEVARIALENVVMDSRPLEDPSRESYADWHIKRGAEAEERSLYDQALFEYRRGLRVYPYSKKGRVLFAELLRKRGLPAKQLAELKVVKDIGKADAGVLDAIEIYDSLLEDSVSRLWGVDQYALQKRPYRVAFFALPERGEGAHTAGSAILLRYLADLLAASSRLAVLQLEPRVANPAEAFRRAREAEADYYVLFRARESDRDLELQAELRVARTGSPAGNYRAYRSGNDRVKNTAARLASLLESALEPKGSVLRRSQDRALADLGAADGFKAGDKLLVVKRGSLDVKPEGLGPAYPPGAVVGELTLVRVDEEVAEGTLKSSGFFDTINTGDELVILPPPPAAATSAGKPAGAAKPPAAATATGAASVAAEPQWPGLFFAVRRLR